MNAIRNIRIATGIKRIELGNDNMVMLQIGEVLKQHRESLIASLLSDLATYVKYKFATPATRDQLEKIRHKLLDLKNAGISLTRYNALIEDVINNETTYIRSEAFYHEINEVIGEELNPTQLTLVK